MPKPIIILGAYSRPAAASAVRAGYEPWAVDVYARRDLRQLCRAEKCDAKDFPGGILKMLERAPVPIDAPVLLGPGMENHPDVVEAIAFERDLMGCSPESIRKSRHPRALHDLPSHKGLKFCKLATSGGLRTRAGQWFRAMLGGKGYLLKPRNSFGGRGIQSWGAAQAVAGDYYLQQYIKGTPVSAVFRGDGWSCHLVGVTEQLIGESSFGGQGYRYNGNIGPLHTTDQLRRAIMHLGVVLTQRFDLRGLFGIDGMLDFSGNFWPVEVNPRFTDSIEILELAQSISILGGQLMHDDSKKARTGRRPTGRISGKAVLYAKRAVVVPDLIDALPNGEIADVPDPGRGVRQGGLLATVYTKANSRDQCEKTLRNHAKAVYALVDASQKK